MATTIPPRVKIDPRAAMQGLMNKADAAAQDRFSLAEKITSEKPTGLSVSHPVTPTSGKTSLEFDIAACVPGSIVRVPLHLIDLNELGPRQIYQSAEVDKIAETIVKAQDDAAHGYLKGGRVQLIDGGTRYRSAKVSGIGYLDVKFEEEPKSLVDLYLRARQYNDQRSQPTAIDHAISLRKLLESKEITSNQEIAELIPDLSGRPMSEAQVSTYMRISRMPDRVLQRMSESTLTSGVRVLYAVSDIFKQVPEEADALDIAFSVIDDIKQKELSTAQVIALVNSKLAGVKHRERSTQQPLTFGTYKGVIKMFAKRGQVDLSLKGLPASELPELQKELMATVEKFVSRISTSNGSTPGNTPSQ